MAPRILLVESDPELARSLYELLSQLGIPGLDVDVAPSLKVGVLQVDTESWDVVAAEEHLPDGRGTALLTRVARRRPATRRVLLAALPDPDLLHRAVNEAHVDLFVAVPWEPATLRGDFERLLGEIGVPRRPEGFGRIPPAN